jgi:hypothetical protein
MTAAQNDFPLYSHQQRFIDKSSLSCYSGTAVVAYAFIGAILIVVAVFGIVAMLVYELLTCFHCLCSLFFRRSDYVPIASSEDGIITHHYVEMAPSAPFFEQEIPVAIPVSPEFSRGGYQSC